MVNRTPPTLSGAFCVRADSIAPTVTHRPRIELVGDGACDVPPVGERSSPLLDTVTTISNNIINELWSNFFLFHQPPSKALHYIIETVHGVKIKWTNKLPTVS